jgi:hypothetical protein
MNDHVPRSQWIHYYVVPGNGRNAGIHVTYGWFPLSTLKHRGWLDHRVSARPPSNEELECIHQWHRHTSFRYERFEQLVEDEEREGTPHPGCITN